ncbi:MAG TPA: acyl-CoA dehydrogenase [Hellea balneolensis]|uniref:Acyl-CoA dehydrogenase n=1 Tax=Hellea balneolensis TaxID=287478 RepID=A0A7V5U1I7_9PROT|nr:acyl-CoA dehydrogenase [Hellea balneolensis]
MTSPFDTEERLAFRKTIRDFVKREITPHAFDWDEAHKVPWEIHEKLGALGVFGFGVEEKYGGLGFDDAFMRAAYAEEMANCGVVGIMAAVGGRQLAMSAISRLAPEPIRAKVLPEIISGRKNAALAITEPGGGSDVANLTTHARREGDDYILSGAKTFITGGMTASYIVVGARTGGPGVGGISLLFVDADTEGLSRTELARKTGWWASDQASLYFDNVKVPAENLMGAEGRGFVGIMDSFNYERLGLIAGSLGMMRACLEDATEWARERKTFGKPLIGHQVIRHKLVEMSARIEAVACWLDRICWQINSGDMPVASLAKAKFFTTKALEYCVSEAIQVLGGAGYLRGCRIENIFRDYKVMAIGGGSEEIMRELAATQMGLTV